MQRDLCDTAEHVSHCLQLAILLEVSAHKPGNVNKSADFGDTRFEHFLSSAVAAAQSFSLAARRGFMVFDGEIEASRIHVGEIIKEAIIRINAWKHGGNTLFGTVLLLTPIAAAAGMHLAEGRNFSISKIRENIKLVVESTTSHDAVAVYEAIDLAKPGGLVDKAPTLDVNDPESKKTILEKDITLYDVFRISAPYDSISKEWVENYPITFDLGLPYFNRQLEEVGNLNTAIVHTFLKVLSEVPDTLIARKVGVEKAEEVSKEAEKVLDLGGLMTPQGRDELSSFDKKLRKSANLYNPGTTADITSAVLALRVLEGYRP